MQLFRKKSKIQSGGRIANCRSMKPVEQVKGSVLSAHIEIHQHDTSYQFDYDGTELTARYSDVIKGSYQTSIVLEEGQKQLFAQAIKHCGLNAYNGWDVRTAGLPITKDASVYIAYTSKEEVSIRFNGGHAPDGFFDAAEKLYQAVCSLTDYSEEKLKKPEPVKNPMQGIFTYECEMAKGKKQTFEIEVLEQPKEYAVVIRSDGSLGPYVIAANISKLYGGQTNQKYHLYYLKVLEGTADKAYRMGDLLGIFTYDAKTGMEFEMLRLKP